MNETVWPSCAGETAALLRQLDWAATPLGPAAAWPEQLRTLVELVLRTPMASTLIWGEAGTLIYNDAYARICGRKHPHVFGAAVRDAWPEAWDFNGDMMARCHRGEPAVFQGAHFVLERGGEMRDSWFDLYYAPVFGGDGKVAGVLATVIENTQQKAAELVRAAHEQELRRLNGVLDAQRAQLEAANDRLAGDMALLSRLFELSPSFMAVLLGPDHVFELSNAAYDRLVQHRQLRGRPVREALPEIAGQGFLAILDRVYRSGEPFHGQNVEVMLDGGAGKGIERRLLDFVYQPLKDAQGQTYGIFVEGIDVTAHALAEERLRVAQEAGGIGTFEWYPDRGELQVSDAYRRVWGFAPQTPVTSDLLMSLVDPAYHQLSGVSRLGQVSNPLEYAEYPITRADTGERRWLARRGQVAAGLPQEGPRYLGVTYDITDRKQAELDLREAQQRLSENLEALRASEARLSTVLAQAAVGLSEADLNGRFTRVNDALCRMLGRTREELLTLSYTDVIHPDDRAHSVGTTRKVIVDGGVTAVEKRYLRPDGSEVWGLTNVSRIVDSQGRPTALIAVSTDLTERRKVEQTLRDMNESLERKVEQEVTERIKAEDALRQAQKMEAVGQLASGVAHDFNNVLQIISSNLQLMELDPSVRPLLRSRLGHAIAAVERGSKLSSQLLAFARRQPLQPVVTHLGQLLRNIEPLLQRALGDAHTLSIEVAPNLWNTAVDPNQIENAILNMAINARDAMAGPGRVAIMASNRPGHAPADARMRAADYVALTVSDTGCGMPPAVLAKVFDPFYTTKEPGKGTGLGLSMVYGFVKQSGGEIRIDSEPGLGTSITIELPRSYETHAAPLDAQRSPVQGGDETILVVEDDAAVRAAALEILTGLGYRVLKAGNGEQALAILQSGMPVDLVFTDVSMPGEFDCVELIAQAAVLAPRAAILLTSGHALDRSLLDARIPTAIELLPKPYGLAQLAQAVREQLGRHNDAALTNAGTGATLPRADADALRILVVEDDRDARDLACEMLAALGHRAHGAGSAEQALDALAGARFDVLFTDLNLPGLSGDKLAVRACAADPGLAVILASGDGAAAVSALADKVVPLPKPYDLMQLQLALGHAARVGDRLQAHSTGS